jgi:hypothetical protein
MLFNKTVKKSKESRVTFVSGKPIMFNIEVDKSGVSVKLDGGPELGYAKIVQFMEKDEKVYQLTHFVTFSQNKAIVRMLLSGILLLAESNNVKRIDAYPQPDDLQVKEANDAYDIFKNLGFEFFNEQAETKIRNKRMFYKI